MALIACNDCGKEVSTDAKNCPGCGAKIPKKSGLGKLILVLVVGVSAFFGIGIALQDSPEVRAKKFDQAKEECSMVGAKIAIPSDGSIGNGNKAISAIEDCMYSHGFKVNMK